MTMLTQLTGFGGCPGKSLEVDPQCLNILLMVPPVPKVLI